MHMAVQTRAAVRPFPKEAGRTFASLSAVSTVSTIANCGRPRARRLSPSPGPGSA